MFEDSPDETSLWVEKGEVRNGKREGLWTTYLNQPPWPLIWETSEYRNGLLHGEYRDQHGGPDHGVYRNGKKHGHWVEHSIFGFAHNEEGDYDADRRVGTWILHDHDGRVLQSTTYRAGRRHGPYTWLHLDGSKREERAYDRDRKTGTWRTWNQHGVLLEEQGFRRGQPHGYFRRWHYATRKLVLEMRYVDGVPDGRASVWREDGRLVSETTYKNGTPHRSIQRP